MLVCGLDTVCVVMACAAAWHMFVVYVCVSTLADVCLCVGDKVVCICFCLRVWVFVFNEDVCKCAYLLMCMYIVLYDFVLLCMFQNVWVCNVL